MSSSSDRYTHGHHESVLRSHTWRTAENSASFLLPHLTPGMSLLDVGCGPGTITADLAARLSPGRVVGIDPAATVIEAASAAHAAENLTFATGSVYALDDADDTYDVVYAHQVLQHLAEPVAALREMRRVVRPGGLVAVRDSDYGAFVWSPADPVLSRWSQLYHELTVRNGAEADAGRFLHMWARHAGFSHLRVSTSTWTFSTPEERSWWGGLWADRVRVSDFADQALEYGLTDRAELDRIAATFLRWADDLDGWFVVLHGEVLATK